MKRKLKHQIYKAALIKLKYQHSMGRTSFSLCMVIISVTRDFGAEKMFMGLATAFPELWKFEPLIHERDDGYWWDRKDFNTRKMVLKYCILITKKK